MVAITATNSATPSLQETLIQSRLQQARREADAAETNYLNLRTQTDQAEQDSEKSQGKVQTLTSQNTQAQVAQATYSAQASKPSAVPQMTQDFLVRLYSSTSQQFADSGNPLKTNANAAPVVNAQGQATGRIVNISA
jgi:hypothetical protein